MWILRRMADAAFPKPIVIGRRNYWRVEAVKFWLEQQEAKS